MAVATLDSKPSSSCCYCFVLGNESDANPPSKLFVVAPVLLLAFVGFVNVSLTVACCTKPTAEIATLIALTAAATTVQQQQRQQVKTYLKIKEI